jgi:hypothetical protein
VQRRGEQLRSFREDYMRIVRWYLLGLFVITVSLIGCGTTHTTSNLEQENRGMGIVQGTLGTVNGVSIPSHASTVMRGQVLGLEGGAYVVRTSSGEEVRVPLDENTSSDRPAHVGDHIEVHFDAAHRALQIRNIDGHLKK